MQDHRKDPRYQLHDLPQPPDETDDHLSAEEFRDLSVERENTAEAVQQRENMDLPAPSELRKEEAEHGEMPG
jgi:hypothetical protein